MADNRTPFQKFKDLATAIVRVPKEKVAARPVAARPVKQAKTKRPKT